MATISITISSTLCTDSTCKDLARCVAARSMLLFNVHSSEIGNDNGFAYPCNSFHGLCKCSYHTIQKDLAPKSGHVGSHSDENNQQ